MQDPEPEYGFEIISEDKFAKKKKTKQDVDDFDKYSLHEAIFRRPQNLMGSCEPLPRKLSIFNFETGLIEEREINTPKAMERCFLEIFTNATDGIRKSRENGAEAGKIKIHVKGDTISIENDGLPIPIAPHKYLQPDEEFETVLDLIFGNLLAGSNLNDEFERTESGANAYGAKLTNIMSTFFKVEVGDNIRGCKQTIIWTGNMINKVSSVCEPPYRHDGSKWVLNGRKYSGPNFVRVTYKQDFRKFKPNNDYYYSVNDMALYMKYIIGSSFSSSVVIKVKIEDVFEDIYEQTVDYTHISRFADLIDPESKKTRVYARTWTVDQEEIIEKMKTDREASGKKMTQRDIDKMISDAIATGKLKPQIDMCLLDSPNKGFHISYCNGIYNIKGGVYTNEAYRVCLDFIKGILKSDKSFAIAEAEIDKMDIKTIKKHGILIINYNCISPVWDHQEKEAVDKPKPKIVIPKDETKNMKGWKMLDAIYDAYHEKNKPPSTNKRTRKIVSGDFVNANFINKKGVRCRAIICEGKSAGGAVDEYIMSLEGGFDTNAKIPAKGKIKNVYGLTPRQIDVPIKGGTDNEIKRIIDIIGLEDGVDYENPKNVEKLVYQEVLIFPDADDDGIHILCLFINLFYIRFPSFIKAGLLKWLRSPIIRALNSKDEQIAKFYNVGDYAEWAKNNPKIKHNPQYLKGLASSFPEHMRDDAKDPALTILYFDDEAEIYLNVAFSQDTGSSSVRKEWMQEFKNNIDAQIVEYEKQGRNTVSFVRVSNLLNSKLIEYSLATLPRALVSIYDHFKLSQRQIMWYLLEEYNYGKSNKNPKRLIQIANAAADFCDYHHGDLTNVVARLGHSFAGSNNLPLITGKGHIGTRTELGKDCGAGRYVFSDLNWWISYVFKKDLIYLIERKFSEGKKLEPKYLVSLFPLALANGTDGLATGWSCEMTQYHPGDVIEWIIRYISGEKVFPMVPWYMNYRGNVTLEMKTKTYKKTNQDLMDDTKEIPETYTGLTCRTEGIYTIHREYERERTVEEPDPNNEEKMIKVKKTLKHYDLEITELPIGIEPKKLHLKLSALCDEPLKKSSDSNKPHYIYNGYYGSIEPKDIGMVSRQGLTNITMVDESGAPVSYKNIYEVLDTYCGAISNVFELYKETKINDLKKDMEKLLMKLFLVRKVLAKEWHYIGVSKKQIEKDLQEFEIPRAIFTSLSGEQYTEYGANELEQEYGKKEEELRKVEETSHLQQWIDYLIEFYEAINKRKEYKKLPQHEYDIVECDAIDLIEGRILAPYELKKQEKNKEK